MIEIEKFDVKAFKHPSEASDSTLEWNVLIGAKFKSNDPNNWGEFRAYGGAWTRTINRTHTLPNFYKNKEPRPDKSLKGNPRKSEDFGQLETQTSLPFGAF